MITMDLMDTVRAKAKARPQVVAFPEANDLKMVKAIDEVVNGGYCKALIVGNINEVKDLCKTNGIDDSKWEYIDNNDEANYDGKVTMYIYLILYMEKSL